MFLFHSYDKLESSKKFVPTVSRKVEPDWARNFENDHFAPLISVDDILSFDDAGLSSHNSSPLYKGSPPPRKASSTGMLDGGKHSISLSLSIYIYIFLFFRAQCFKRNARTWNGCRAGENREGVLRGGGMGE